MVQSSLIEAADGYKSCFCSLLAHTCPWQCHCWWPRHSWRQQRQRHRSSAAALPKSRQCALKSPAYSHGLQQLQILLPDLPTCVTWEPGIPSAHTMFHSSCIQQHLGIWNSLVAKYFPLLHWIIFSDIMCRIAKPSLLKVFPLWTNREGARCSCWGQKGQGWGFFWGPTSASRASHNTLSSILFTTQQMQSHWLSTE